MEVLRCIYYKWK